MATYLCEYAFEDDDGRERVWDVYGSYTPPRPPPWTNGDHDSPSFSDSGDPEQIEIAYAEEGKQRVSVDELWTHDKRIREQIHEDPPVARGRGRRLKDYEED